MPIRRLRPSLRRTAPLLLLLLLIAAAAGCGGGSSSGGATLTVTSEPGAGSGLAALPAAAVAVDDQLVRVVQQLSPRVAQVESSTGLGSGVVFDNRGDIVTNAHVVGNDQRFTVTLSGGARLQAKLIGSFAPDDLAVIRLDPVPATPPPAATFADSSKLQVGQLVLAIGNPLGLRSSVTNGIISSLGRTVPEGGGAVITSAIQTSAAINPGNSGGALGSLDGSVVGIPTLAAIDPELGSQAPGIGFAIPANTVKRIAGQLIASGHVTNSGRAVLGVGVATTMAGDGVVVTSVQRGGPAAAAGLARGDVILSLAGRPTPTADAYSATLALQKVGSSVAVRVRSATGGATMVRQVTLGPTPAGR
jgi:S1-C subfamily serine protease